MPGLDVSFCMITRSGGAGLRDCLASVAPLVDELIVVDTGSRDDAPEVARAFDARVVPHPWMGDFSAARNAYLDVARGRYVLSLDADERLAPWTRAALHETLDRHPRHAFVAGIRTYHPARVTGFDVDAGTWVSPVLPGLGMSLSYTVRLFPNEPAVRYRYPVHESLRPSFTAAGIPTAPLPVAIHHFGPLDGVAAGRAKAADYKRLALDKLERFPESAPAHCELARILMCEADFAGAGVLFETARRLSPDLAEAQYGVCVTLLRRSRREQCRAEVASARARFPRARAFARLQRVLDESAAPEPVT